MSANAPQHGHVVVTGGSGFVGSHFVSYLLDRGASRIAILDRNEFTERSPLVRSVITDISEGIPWAPDGPIEVVYHLAAACREPGFTTAQYFRDNLQATVRLAEWAGRHGVRNIVFTSTMMVYGARDERVTEDSDTRPDTDYGRSKLQAEQVLRAWQSAAPGRRLRIVRPAVIFGKAERNNFTKLHRALRRRTFAFIGRDSTVKSCIYVKDFVRLLELLASDMGPHQLYNAAYPEPTTIRNVCDAMCRAYGWRRSIPTVPYGLARAAALPFEALDSIGVARTGIHRRRIEKLYLSTNIEADRMSSLNFRPEFDLFHAIEDWKRDCNGGPLQ